MDGSWSCWSSWSKCSVTCGGGHYMRTRTCSNPPPAYGGDICLGLHTEEALCNTQPCPGTHTHTHSLMISSFTGLLFIFFRFFEPLRGHPCTTKILIQCSTHTHSHTPIGQAVCEVCCHCRFQRAGPAGQSGPTVTPAAPSCVCVTVMSFSPLETSA